MNKTKTKKLKELEKKEKEKNEIFKPNEKEWYTGLIENTIKERNNTHKSNCNLPAYDATTNLSKYVWKLKRHYYTYSIKWKIVARARTYNPATKQCNLCSKEKFFIIFKPETATLNDKNEMVRKCPHRRKWLFGTNKAQKM